jgi:uncharacterized protein
MPRLVRILAVAACFAMMLPGAAWPVRAQEQETLVIGFNGPGQGFQDATGFTDHRRVRDEIDQFWRDVFDEAVVTYRPPYAVIALDRAISTACGPASPSNMFFYCSADESIYLSPAGLEAVARKYGDYAPITILAHEWGHHVQNILGVPTTASNELELQADCLAGAWTRHAQTLGLLDKGDVAEAAKLSAESGDDYWASQEKPGAHGIDDDRITHFMRGYDDGLADCDLPLAIGGMTAPVAQVPRAVPAAPTGLPVAAYLPAGPALAHGGCFFLSGSGTIDWPGILQRFSDIPRAESQLAALGWSDGAYIQYGCNGPPPGSAGWIEIGVHRLADPTAAQAAVPYFAAGRMTNTTLTYLPSPPLGTASAAITGPATNGTEVTMYASTGPLLVRVTGVSPSGAPVADVTAVMAQVLSLIQASG